MIGPEQTMSSHMRERRRNGIVYLLIALVLAVTLGAAYRTDRRADDFDRERGVQGHQIQELQGQVESNGKIATDAKAAAEEANRRLAAAGEPTVPVPSSAPVSPPESPGLSEDQIRLIVVQELAAQNITVTQAEINQIARTVSALQKQLPTQVGTAATLAVGAYCIEDRCAGKPGTPGKDGKDGADGKDAPKVTDEELLRAAQAALLSYCGQETQPCKGEPGAPGSPGPAGRGIEDTDCLEDGTWRISYSDGTTQIKQGPCRVMVPPNGN